MKAAQEQGVCLAGLGLPELFRYGNAQNECPKEKRLRSLARRAGDLSVSAYLGGNRDRAIFFNEKRKRILWAIWTSAQQEIV
jgi:hypothetical protein